MERDNLNQRAEQIGEISMAHFRRWQDKYSVIGDVRGLGAMTALEFIQGKGDRTPNADVPPKIVGEAYRRGLLLIRAASTPTACARLCRFRSRMRSWRKAWACWRAPLPPWHSLRATTAIMQNLTITTIRPEHFAALEALQRACYPTLGTHELMRVEHYASQYAVFAEGQIVVLDGERVIGQGSGFFIDFDFAHPEHRFSEICDGFYFRNHEPDGAYYYGADISVHPDYRARGSAS